MINDYFEKVSALLDQVKVEEHEAMEKAAKKVSKAVQAGGIIHLFGCGHSHILTEEMFYRAGGLAPVHPIFVEPLMLHEGAVRSSHLEKQQGYAAEFMPDQNIRSEDVVFVFSTSGRNPVPVDVALFSKEKGAQVIGITSVAYSKSQPSRHESGKRLLDVVDVVIDNHVPKGDAIMQHEQVPVAFGSPSTVVGATIMNAIFSEAVKRMAEAGFEPPVFLSGNLEGAAEHNEKLVERYKKDIPLLR